MRFEAVEDWRDSKLNGGYLFEVEMPNGVKVFSVVSFGNSRDVGQLSVPLYGVDGTLAQALTSNNEKRIGSNLSSSEACDQMGLRFNYNYENENQIFTCTSLCGSQDRNGMTDSIQIYGFSSQNEFWSDEKELLASIITATGMLGSVPMRVVRD